MGKRKVNLSTPAPLTVEGHGQIGTITSAWIDVDDCLTIEGVVDEEFAHLLSDLGGRYSVRPPDENLAAEAVPEPVVSPRRALLMQAADLVDGDRNAQYGDPNQDFQRTATLWNTYLSGVAERKGLDVHTVEALIDTWDVGWMMQLLKASRSTVSPAKEDHYADAAGYAACAWHCIWSVSPQEGPVD
jgi:Domain of unknown function (DUF6378)